MESSNPRTNQPASQPTKPPTWFLRATTTATAAAASGSRGGLAHGVVLALPLEPAHGVHAELAEVRQQFLGRLDPCDQVGLVFLALVGAQHFVRVELHCLEGILDLRDGRKRDAN